MNLRDLINENTRQEELDVLANQPFEVDVSDFKLLAVIGVNHAKRFPDTHGRIPWDHEEGFEEAYRSWYDYSPEMVVIGDYAIHKMGEAGICSETLGDFQMHLKYSVLSCTDPKNRNSYDEQSKQIKQKLRNSPDYKKVQEILLATGNHLEHIQSDFSNSITNEERKTLPHEWGHEDIVLGARHRSRNAARVLNLEH